MSRAKSTGIVALFIGLAAASIGGFVWVHGEHEREKQEAAKASAAQLEQCEHAREEERSSKNVLLAKGEADLSASQAELQELRAEHEEAEKRLEAFTSLTAKFRKMIDSGRLQVAIRHGRMIVKLPASVLFESGSAELSKDGVEALREVAAILKQVQGRRFMVAGHTDNVPVGSPTSPFMNNLDLSTSRALIVAQNLIKAGMNPAQLVAAGYGEYEPVADNRSEAGRRENRRIEIVLMPNITEVPDLLGDAGAPAPKDASADAPQDAGAPTPKASPPNHDTSHDAGSAAGKAPAKTKK